MAVNIPIFNNGDLMEDVRMKSLNPAIEALNTMSAHMDDMNTDISGDLADVTLQVNTLQGDVTSLSTQTNAVSDMANSAITKANTNGTTIATLVDKSNHHDSLININTNEIADVGTRLLSIESTNTDQTTQLASITSELSGNQDQFTDINTALDHVELEMSGRQVEVDHNTANIVINKDAISNAAAANTGIDTRLKLLEFSGTHGVFAQDNKGFGGVRYSLSTRPGGVPLPCGIHVSGNASITNDPSVNQIQGGSYTGEGALQFNAYGTATITTEINIASDVNVPAGGSEEIPFWWVSIDKDGVEAVIDASQFSITVLGSEHDNLVRHVSPPFTLDVNDGDRVGLKAQATGDGIAYLDSHSSDDPSVKVDITYIEAVDISKMKTSIINLEDKIIETQEDISGLFTAQKSSDFIVRKIWNVTPMALDTIEVSSILSQDPDTGYLRLEGGVVYEIEMRLETKSITDRNGSIALRLMNGGTEVIRDINGHNVEHIVEMEPSVPIEPMVIKTQVSLSETSMVRPLILPMQTNSSPDNTPPEIELHFSPTEDQHFNIWKASGSLGVVAKLIQRSII